jgi:hypothetical protein
MTLLGCIDRGCSSMVELQPSKLVVRVRFPSPALFVKGHSAAPACSFFPCLETRIVMEAREHPSEQAEARLPAPTIRVAVARQEPGGLFRSAHQGKEHVSHGERKHDLLHELKARVA